MFFVFFLHTISGFLLYFAKCNLSVCCIMPFLDSAMSSACYLVRAIQYAGGHPTSLDSQTSSALFSGCPPLPPTPITHEKGLGWGPHREGEGTGSSSPPSRCTVILWTQDKSINEWESGHVHGPLPLRVMAPGVTMGIPGSLSRAVA